MQIQLLWKIYNYGGQDGIVEHIRHTYVYVHIKFCQDLTIFDKVSILVGNTFYERRHSGHFEWEAEANSENPMYQKFKIHGGHLGCRHTDRNLGNSNTCSSAGPIELKRNRNILEREEPPPQTEAFILDILVTTLPLFHTSLLVYNNDTCTSNFQIGLTVQKCFNNDNNNLHNYHVKILLVQCDIVLHLPINVRGISKYIFSNIWPDK